MSTALAGGPTRIVASCAVLAALVLSGCTSSSTHGTAGSSASARPSSSPSRAPHRLPAKATSSAPDPVAVAHAEHSAGRVLRVTIPSSTTFRPQPAFVYLPPAQQAHPDRPLPVLELLHGTPGVPSDWFDRGSLLATANGFAAKHGGQSPVIVVPDINGTRRADSECIRTTYGGDVETYLTRDVVAWVRHRYARTVGTRRWWVAGLSEGGLCSIMLALRHPTIYSSFGDFSGLLRPVVEHVTPAQSDQILYRGSTTARLQHDPSWLLAHHRYPGLYGWFATGSSDRRTLAAQSTLVPAARKAGIVVHAETQPGKHAWPVWTYELRALLPWLWARDRG